ncbi:hypothetical protein RUND412_006531 [Rhizina undulata]
MNEATNKPLSQTESNMQEDILRQSEQGEEGFQAKPGKQAVDTTKNVPGKLVSEGASLFFLLDLDDSDLESNAHSFAD